MLFRLLSSHLLKAATNLCEGQCVTRALWKQHSPFNGGSERLTFCSHFVKYLWCYFCNMRSFFLLMDVFMDACSTTCFIFMYHYCGGSPETQLWRLRNNRVIQTKGSLGFSRCWFPHHISSLWCNNESVMCSCFPNPDSFCASISQVSSPTARVVFVLYEPTADPADHKSCWMGSESVELNLHHKRGKYLLRSIKALANRGDPSRAFKMSHLSLFHLHNL